MSVHTGMPDGTPTRTSPLVVRLTNAPASNRSTATSPLAVLVARSAPARPTRMVPEPVLVARFASARATPMLPLPVVIAVIPCARPILTAPDPHLHRRTLSDPATSP